MSPPPLQDAAAPLADSPPSDAATAPADTADGTYDCSGASEAPAGYGQGDLIKKTRSICPQCLEGVDAKVFERDGAVWMDKRCDAHGAFSALLASSARHYYVASADEPVAGPAPPCCSGGGCGPSPAAGVSAGTDADQITAPWTNHSCTLLIEITERCNLTCPTCFAGSSPQHSKMMSLETYAARLDRLLAGGKRNADVIQLSGGEPTIHPQIFEMIDMTFAKGFANVCINSNGIKLAQADFVERLGAIAASYPGTGLSVYLQFDGFDDATFDTLRGRADLLAVKQRALRQCLAAGLIVHPVMTLTRGVNDHEVGEFIRLGRDEPALRHLMIQPAMYSGRYDNPRRTDRLTLADTVQLVCEQSGVFEPADFGPIPCSDPNCYGIAVALRRENGSLLPLSRYFPRHAAWQDDDARDLISALSDTLDGPGAFGEALRWASEHGQLDELFAQFEDDEVDELLDVLATAQHDREAAWDRMFMVSIKPFMDAFTYDQDRIDACCVHILDDDGNPVSFCEYNAVTRPRMVAARATGA